MTEPHTFVLLSGGIDSAVCLQYALEEYDDVAAFHFDYGQQTAAIEARNARTQAKAAGIPLHEIDYREVFGAFAEGTIDDQEYERDAQTAEGHSVGYVPQRNLHFLVSAAAVAEHNTATGRPIVLIYGAQGGDHADYPDCRPGFVDAAETAIQHSTDQHEVRVEAPVIDHSKAEVLERGDRLGVEWSLTFSCYNDRDGDPCGECPACVERKDAFAEADLTDPLVE